MATKAHELNSASPERVAYSENSPLLSENQVKGSNEISQDTSTQIGRIDNSKLKYYMQKIKYRSKLNDILSA